MTPLLSGIAVLVIGLASFWYCMPRNGVTHRFVGTELEPYVGVAFCAAAALSATLIFSGIIELLG